MTKEELFKRREKLLQGKELYNAILKMIKVKKLPATCHSITAITGRDGRGEIVVELYIDILNTANIARAYLYLTEDIFDPDCFSFIDDQIGLGSIKVNIDAFIKLRALRTVYNVINNISTRYANAIDYSKIIYVRTVKNGTCEYHN